MVAVHHPHLGPAPRSGRLDSGAGLIKNVHVADRARRQGVCPFDFGALRPDLGKIVANSSSASHRLRSLGQGLVDRRQSILILGHRISHRLHKAIDQRRLDVRPAGRIDAARRDESMLHRPNKFLPPPHSQLRLLDHGHAIGHPISNQSQNMGPGHLLGVFRVFLQQHIQAYILDRQCGMMAELSEFYLAWR